MNCPWNSFKPSKIDFCEQNLCAWISEPASSYSCVFYLLFGVIILKNRKNIISSYFGIISICIGLFSFVFHATLTFVGSMLDLGSMYLLATTLIYINITRFEKYNYLINSYLQTIYFVFSNFFLLVYTYFFEETTGIFYLFLMIAVIILEIIHYFNSKNKQNFKWIYFALFGYIGGSFFWYLDTYRVYCNPENHIINGHVIWHCMSAFAIFSVYKYYFPIVENITKNKIN